MLKQLKNATKKISAIGAAALMVGSVAFSAGLSSYPDNFVKNDKFTGKIVVGSGDGADDDAAANSIISNLQNTFSGAQEQVEITYTKGSSGSGSSIDLKLKDSKDNNLYLGGNLTKLVGTKDIDKKTFSSVFEKKTLTEDTQDVETDYEQTLVVTDNNQVNFDRSGDINDDDSSSYSDSPEVNLKISGAIYTYTVDFKKNLKVFTTDDDKLFQNSETINLFGKEFTFGPDTGKNADGDLELYSSSKTVTHTFSGTPIGSTFDKDGITYDVKIIGADSENNKVTVQVNGVSRSLKEGESKKINGLEIFVKAFSINNFGTKGATTELFLGGDKLELPTASTSFEEFKLSDETIDGYQVKVTGTKTDGIDKIEFQYNPKAADDETSAYSEQLLSGNSIVDPLFGISLTFNGASRELKSDEVLKVEGEGENLKVSFTNIGDIETKFTPYYTNSTANVQKYNDGNEEFITTGTLLKEDNFFVLNDDEDIVSEKTSTLYSIKKIKIYAADDDDDSYVEITDLTNDETTTYTDGDDIIDGYTISIGNVKTNEQITLSNSVNDYIITKNGLKATFNENNIVVNEITLEDRENTNIVSNTIFLSSSSGDDITVKVSGTTTGNSGESDEDDNKYFLTNVGTLFIEDTDGDNDNGLVTVYASADDLTFGATLSTGKASDVSTEKVLADRADERKAELTAAGNTISKTAAVSQNVVEFDVTAPIKDSAVTAGESNLIVVGGPVVNSVAAELVGDSYEAGKAYVKYFNDRNTVLVFGYTKAGTAKAASALSAGGISSDKTLSE